MPRRFSDIPFRPARLPFFYGWVVVGLGTLGLIASTPGQTIGVSAFTDPLIAALGLTRDQLALAYMGGTIGGALLLAPAGKLYDRIGARLLMAATCVLLGGVLVGLSQCDRLAAGLAGVTGLPAGWAAFGVIFFGFFALRLTGQGVLALASRNMIMEWFERRRGLAFAVSGVFVALGFSVMPRVFDAMIGAWTWRGTWQVAAAAVGLGMAALALVLFRDTPEDCGLRPDGAPPEPPGGGDGPRVHPVRQYTLAEARRTFSFWVFAVALSMFGLFVTGLTFHVASVFEEVGFDEEVAFGIFLPSAFVSVTVRLGAGWLSDRVRLKFLLMAMMASLGLVMVGVVLLEYGWTRWLLIVGNGVCMAHFGLLSGVVWPRFYGRAHLGAVSGLAMAMTVFASALGPYLLSRSLVWLGSYRPAAWLCLGMTGVLFVAAFWADNPQGEEPGRPA